MPEEDHGGLKRCAGDLSVQIPTSISEVRCAYICFYEGITNLSMMLLGLVILTESLIIVTFFRQSTYQYKIVEFQGRQKDSFGDMSDL